mmetsp:Transcript_7087/g.11657  ORF Transcript_7087/g.11657 Transcript_7087/m.11657 type:complete len:84 (-) Transcript_7087:5-256(-)
MSPASPFHPGLEIRQDGTWNFRRAFAGGRLQFCCAHGKKESAEGTRRRPGVQAQSPIDTLYHSNTTGPWTINLEEDMDSSHKL